jgi:hypothetical protein
MPIFLWLALGLLAAGENATWVHRRWWSGSFSPEAIATLARHFEAHGVRWVFPKAGGLRPSVPPRAARFVAALHAQSPRIRILPWVSGYAHRHLGRGARFAERTARRLAQLVNESGADGIHIDIEPPFGAFGQIPGERIARLGHAFRRHAPGKLVSLAIHPMRTASFPRGLDPSHVRPLLAVADQVVVMMYDTGISRGDVFCRAIAEQVAALGRLAEGAGRVRLWMGAAAYPRHGRRFRALHEPAVENVAMTTRSLRETVRGSPGAGPWVGIAVFAHYSARPSDWAPLLSPME